MLATGFLLEHIQHRAKHLVKLHHPKASPFARTRQKRLNQLKLLAKGR